MVGNNPCFICPRPTLESVLSGVGSPPQTLRKPYILSKSCQFLRFNCFCWIQFKTHSSNLAKSIITPTFLSARFASFLMISHASQLHTHIILRSEKILGNICYSFRPFRQICRLLFLPPLNPLSIPLLSTVCSSQSTLN